MYGMTGGSSKPRKPGMSAARKAKPSTPARRKMTRDLPRGGGNKPMGSSRPARGAMQRGAVGRKPGMR